MWRQHKVAMVTASEGRQQDPEFAANNAADLRKGRPSVESAAVL
jgi:hypothetical protein